MGIGPGIRTASALKKMHNQTADIPSRKTGEAFWTPYYTVYKTRCRVSFTPHFKRDEKKTIKRICEGNQKTMDEVAKTLCNRFEQMDLVKKPKIEIEILADLFTEYHPRWNTAGKYWKY